jgi:hypothetical protein
MNVTNHNQALSEGTTVGHGQPGVCTTSAIDEQEPKPRRKDRLCKQFKEVLSGDRPKRNPGGTQELKELIAE